jgi:hypothetical protein
MRCEMFTNEVQCSAGAVTILIHGCVHEHLDRTPVCPGHLIEVRVWMDAGETWCATCEESESRPHHCDTKELAEERLEKETAR